jgi:hypothetical protein
VVARVVVGVAATKLVATAHPRQDVARPGHAAHRIASSKSLAIAREVAADAKFLLDPARGDPEACDDLVEPKTMPRRSVSWRRASRKGLGTKPGLRFCTASQKTPAIFAACSSMYASEASVS